MKITTAVSLLQDVVAQADDYRGIDVALAAAILDTRERQTTLIAYLEGRIDQLTAQLREKGVL